MKYAQGQGTTVAHGGRDDGACKREAATAAEWRMVRWAQRPRGKARLSVDRLGRWRHEGQISVD